MKVCYTVLFLVGLLAAIPASAKEKYIAISDSLAANADMLKVKKGNQWLNQIAKWSFGDYTVASSKNSGQSGHTSGNLLHTKSETSISENFSFVLTNKTSDSASVSARYQTVTDSLHQTPLGKGFHLGSEAQVQESNSFTTTITINHDTTETWTMFIGGVRGENTEGHYEASLSSGERKILISDVSTIKDGEMVGLGILGAAFGCEFSEGGHSLGAVQYRGGTFGLTYMVWLRKGLDSRMKLILASAMTAVLQRYTEQ